MTGCSKRSAFGESSRLLSVASTTEIGEIEPDRPAGSERQQLSEAALRHNMAVRAGLALGCPSAAAIPMPVSGDFWQSMEGERPFVTLSFAD